MKARLAPFARAHGSMPPWTRRALLTLLGLVALLLLLAGWGYRALWLRYDDVLAQLEARSGRLDGILQSSARIDKQLAETRAAVQPWLFPGGEGAQNEVIQRLRELVVQNGATLVSSQAVPTPAADGQLAHARLNATIDGDWEQLVRVAGLLQRHRPAFWVRSATLLREGVEAPGMAQKARLTVQLDAPLAPSPEGSVR